MTLEIEPHHEEIPAEAPPSTFFHDAGSYFDEAARQALDGLYGAAIASAIKAAEKIDTSLVNLAADGAPAARLLVVIEAGAPGDLRVYEPGDGRVGHGAGLAWALRALADAVDARPAVASK